MPPCAATVWLRVGKHLGDAGRPQSRRRHSERGAQAGAAGADDHDVIAVLDDFVAFVIACLPRNRQSHEEIDRERQGHRGAAEPEQ